MRPKFIVFEGLDGSGQSTQAKLLQEYLEKKRLKVVLTKEPNDDSPIGKLIRSVLQNKEDMPKESLQLLFSADRAHHIANVINPALESGSWVISDRYMFSTLAYGSSVGIDYNWLKELNRDYPLPDMVFYMNTKPETCMNRINERTKKKRSKNELFEKLESLKKVKEQYDLIAHDREYRPLFVEINGEDEIFEIHKNITDYIEKEYLL